MIVNKSEINYTIYYFCAGRWQKLCLGWLRTTGVVCRLEKLVLVKFSSVYPVTGRDRKPAANQRTMERLCDHTEQQLVEIFLAFVTSETVVSCRATCAAFWQRWVNPFMRVKLFAFCGVKQDNLYLSDSNTNHVFVFYPQYRESLHLVLVSCRSRCPESACPEAWRSAGCWTGCGRCPGPTGRWTGPKQVNTNPDRVNKAARDAAWNVITAHWLQHQPPISSQIRSIRLGSREARWKTFLPLTPVGALTSYCISQSKNVCKR